MKITDRLIGDHKTFQKLGQEMESLSRETLTASNQKRLIRLVELFKDHLLLHAWFEDQFYYPAVYKALEKGVPTSLTKSTFDHLINEHKTIDGYVDQLEREIKSTPIAMGWKQTFALFSLGLKSHMRHEEEELFPVSERLLGEKGLEQLSVEMEKHRSKAPRIRLHEQTL